MTTATLHIHGGNQTIRLPKDMQFEGVDEVEVVRQGGSLLLTPKLPADEPAHSPDGKEPSLLDIMTARPNRSGIDLADIDLEGALPPRGYWEPRPTGLPDVPD